MHPYLAFLTYRFHVEKAREAGIRIEDFYANKFHKEPYILNHVYAQYFHPHTLLERVKDVAFYRRPRTIFKGFTVPDWATAEKQHGWDIDVHSRQAWANAMADFNAETTPVPFWGERQDPCAFEWFRLEQFGKGNQSRLYYNEVPQPKWLRHGGHVHDIDKALYSFTWAAQDEPVKFDGIDTTTPEGRAQYKADYDQMCALTPELIKAEHMMFPHEMPAKVSQEPHFQRVWAQYRAHALQGKINAAVDAGSVSQADADAAVAFLNAGPRKTMEISSYVQGKLGRPDLAEDEGFLATDRVFEAVGLGGAQFNMKTSEAYEDQFWRNYDRTYELSEIEMREQLPIFI